LEKGPSVNVISTEVEYLSPAELAILRNGPSQIEKKIPALKDPPQKLKTQSSSSISNNSSKKCDISAEDLVIVDETAELSDQSEDEEIVDIATMREIALDHQYNEDKDNKWANIPVEERLPVDRAAPCLAYLLQL